MNWYRFLKLSSIHGEYWIMDGQAVPADGEDNHESYVIGTIYESHNLVSGVLENPSSRWQLIQQLASKLPVNGANFNDPDDPILVTIGNSQILEAAGFTPAEIAIVQRQRYQDMNCGRDFGMKEWGWKRVEGQNIETWNLTPADLQTISRGIDNIIDDEGRFDDDGEIDFDPLFNIYVHTGHRWFRDVPLSRIESGNIGGRRFDSYR